MGTGHRRIKGVGENLSPARVPVLWAGILRSTAASFQRGPGWVSDCGRHRTPARGDWGVWTSGILRSLSLMDARDNRLSVSGIPDTVGHCVTKS